MLTVRKTKPVVAAAAAPAAAPAASSPSEKWEAEEAAAAAEEEESIAESTEESVAESAAAEERSPAEELMSAIASMEEQLKSLKKLARSALKGKLVKKAKKDPAAPKAERPAQTTVWSDFVAATKLLMEAEGWPSFITKKGTGVTYAAGVANEEGVFVFEDTGKKPVYKDAMAYAGFRKENGEYTDPGAAAREAAKAEKAAEKEAEKAAKAAQREALKQQKEAEKAEKAAQREAAKAVKEAEKAAKAAAKEAQKAAKTAAKPAVKAAAAKPAAKAAVAKPAAKAAVKPAVAAKPAAGGAGAKASPAASESKPAAPVKPAEEEADEDLPVLWEFKKVKYFKNGLGQVWENKGGKPGAWKGQWDPASNSIDEEAEEPEFEFE
jgi:hypothetical protein